MDELYIESSGHGPPLVMLHGWGMHGGIWDDCMPELEGHVRISKIDLPGHGRSPALSGVADMDALVETIARHCPRRMTLMGWSLGGMIAMEIARRLPGRVERLLLIATTPRFVTAPDWPCGVDPTVLANFGAGLGEDYRRTVRDFLMLQVRGDDHAPELLRQLKQRVFAHGDPDPRALSQGLDILAGTDLRADLEQVACPALVISGERDRLTPPEAGCRLAGMIPDARYVQIGKAAHAPFLSHRREFVAAVAAFTGIAA